jgi:hypothetical protein
MKKVSEMSIGELAAFVCFHLSTKGIKVTLTGGACVSIYSKNKYQSYDLDFIEQFGVKQIELKAALKEIGFNQTGRHFITADCMLFHLNSINLKEKLCYHKRRRCSLFVA